MITLRFRPQGWTAEKIAAMKRKGPNVIRVLMGKMTALAFQLQSKIVQGKLSGQVLKRHTGMLARSVRVDPAHFLDAHTIRASVLSSEGVAFYGKVHERGGIGMYDILNTRARALKFISGGETLFRHSVVHPPALPRHWMQSAETENQNWILAEMEQALKDELEKP